MESQPMTNEEKQEWQVSQGDNMTNELNPAQEKLCEKWGRRPSQILTPDYLRQFLREALDPDEEFEAWWQKIRNHIDMDDETKSDCKLAWKAAHQQKA